jgi:hypothetical protein
MADSLDILILVFGTFGSIILFLITLRYCSNKINKINSENKIKFIKNHYKNKIEPILDLDDENSFEDYEFKEEQIRNQETVEEKV